MMPQKFNYRKHILVCVNDRGEGKACCIKVKGVEIYQELKQFVRDQGLTSEVWVTRTGCLGFCNDKGTTIVVYPEGDWYTEVTLETIDEIKKLVLV